MTDDPALDPTIGIPDDGSAPTEDPRPDKLRRADSLVVVNTGNGKGKSSSAFGMMVRAVARDWNVAVVQFIKSGNWNVGEEKVGRQLTASRGTRKIFRTTSRTPPPGGRKPAN
jgi:cob(I)alamin adenosyltransferase